MFIAALITPAPVAAAKPVVRAGIATATPRAAARRTPWADIAMPRIKTSRDVRKESAIAETSYNVRKGIATATPQADIAMPLTQTPLTRWAATVQGIAIAPMTSRATAIHRLEKTAIHGEPVVTLQAPPRTPTPPTRMSEWWAATIQAGPSYNARRGQTDRSRKTTNLTRAVCEDVERVT